jgi:hypothetical protein
MDPLALLGKPFSSVMSPLDHKGVANIFEEVEPGEENEQFVAATDGSWEILLDPSGAIKTIFLFADKGCGLPKGLAVGMTPDQVQDLLGKPTRSGPESVQPILGPRGSWNRYDYPSHVLHVEYSCGKPLLLKVTFMLPKNAPDAA